MWNKEDQTVTEIENLRMVEAIPSEDILGMVLFRPDS